MSVSLRTIERISSHVTFDMQARRGYPRWSVVNFRFFGSSVSLNLDAC